MRADISGIIEKYKVPTLFNRKSLKSLESKLLSNEKVLFLYTVNAVKNPSIQKLAPRQPNLAKMDTKGKEPGIFAITDKRVMLVYHSLGADEFQEIPVDHIATFQSSKGLVWGEIKIITSVIPFEIEIPRKVYDAAINILNKVISGR